jgi:hypothetical protein
MVKDLVNSNCGEYSSALKNSCISLNDLIDLFNMSIDRYKNFLIYNNDENLDNDDNEHAKSINYNLTNVEKLYDALNERIKKKKIYLEKKDYDLDILKKGQRELIIPL